jgi:hypothetical protein
MAPQQHSPRPHQQQASSYKTVVVLGNMPGSSRTKEETNFSKEALLLMPMLDDACEEDGSFCPPLPIFFLSH